MNGAPKDQAEMLRELARELVSHSPRFEPWVPGVRREGLDALDLLGGLEATTRDHLMTELRAMEASLAPAAAPVASPEAFPSEPVMPAWPSAGRARPAMNLDVRAEYRPALKDPEIMAALNEFRQRKHAAPAPRQSVPAPTPASPVPAANSSGPDPFQAHTSPHVEAAPKLSPKLYRPGAPSMTPLRPLPLP